MDVSVIVCTYNRSASLRETLEALRQQRVDGFQHEVVVVDNNSQDDTRSVVEALVPAFEGRLRYVFESKQGQSPARNTGLREARGRLIAFTDDDVLPDPGWLAALRSAISSFQADCAFGKVLPRYLAPPPPWLGPYFLSRLAVIDRGNEARLVTSSRDQFACANVAMTRQAVNKVGAFNPSLGDQGRRLGGEEDTDYFNRMLALGLRVVYMPEALVHHAVGADRMTPGYFRRWHYGHGLAQARILSTDRGRHFLGVPCWAIREWLVHLAGYLRTRGSRDVERGLIQEVRLFYYSGLICERLRQRTCAWRR
jgi:glycosyltransferase involved in cell wall biosynthesis